MGLPATALRLILLLQAPAVAQYTISVLVGSGCAEFSVGDGLAVNAGLTISGDNGIALDRAGNVYIADGGSRVRKVDPSGISSSRSPEAVCAARPRASPPRTPE